MANTISNQVHWLFRPLSWLVTVPREFSREFFPPTPNNIQSIHLVRTIFSSPVQNFIYKRNPLEVGGAIIFLAGLVTGLVGYIRSGKISKIVGGILSLGGLVSLVTGTVKNNQIFKAVSNLVAGTTDRATSTNEIKINRTPTSAVKSTNDVSLDLLKFSDDKTSKHPVFVEIRENTEISEGKTMGLNEVLQDGTFQLRGMTIKKRSDLTDYEFLVREELKEKYKKNDSDEVFSMLMPRSLEVKNLSHNVYEVRIDEHRINILVPNIYVHNRPVAMEKIFKAIELCLNMTPGNLICLIKEFKLNLGEGCQETIWRYARKARTGVDHRSLDRFPIMTAINGKIGIYTDMFNGPSSSVDRREEMIVKEFLVDKRRLDMSNFTSSSNGLHHEIGHLLREYLISNRNSIRLPPFLTKRGLSIRGNFASDNWGNQANDDVWQYIISVDSNRAVSEYSKVSPNEDFSESLAAYLKDPGDFKRLFPARYEFLHTVIPQVDPCQNNKLRVKKAVLDQIKSTIGSKPPEQGGMLGSKGTDGTITHYYFDKTGSTTSTTYTLDHVTLTRVLKEGWKPNGVEAVGIIHSHPSSVRRPTTADIDYAEKFLKLYPELDRFLIPIVVNTGTRNGEMEIIPYAVVREGNGVKVVDLKLEIVN